MQFLRSVEDPDRDFINRLRSYIRDAQAKLDAMSNFVRVTGGIYNWARDINRILKKADTELNNVQYDPKSSKYRKPKTMDLRWNKLLLPGKR